MSANNNRYYRENHPDRDRGIAKLAKEGLFARLNNVPTPLNASSPGYVLTVLTDNHHILRMTAVVVHAYSIVWTWQKGQLSAVTVNTVQPDGSESIDIEGEPSIESGIRSTVIVYS